MAMFLRPWTLEVVWHRQHVGRAVKHVLLDLNEIDTDPDVLIQSGDIDLEKVMSNDVLR